MLDTYTWVDPAVGNNELAYRRPAAEEHAGPDNLFRTFEENFPAAFNYAGLPEKVYKLRGTVVGAMELMDSNPDAQDIEDLETLPGVTVETVWKFPLRKGPMDFSTFKRWLAKINSEDLCKMLGCARDHCKCPHCKEMVRSLWIVALVCVSYTAAVCRRQRLS